MNVGRATLAAGFLLLVIGLVFGTTTVQLPGVALLILSLSMRAWVRLSSSRLRLQLLPARPTATEGEAYELRVRTSGQARFLPAGWIEHPLLDDPLELKPSLEREVSLELRLQGRGRQRLKGPTVVLADPLGQCRARVPTAGAAGVLVLPRVEPIERSGGEGGEEGISEAQARALESLLDGSSSARSAGVDVDVDGLRPHQPGSPSSRIHWPTVARTGEMFERQLLTSSEGGPLVLVDSSDPSSPEALDSAVRAATSLCFALARAGGCSLVLSGRARPMTIDRGLRAWPAAHVALALVEATRNPPSTRRRRLDAAFWVTASADPPSRVPTSARVTYVVSPGPSGGPTAFEVAGCKAWLLGRAGARRRELVA